MMAQTLSRLAQEQPAMLWLTCLSLVLFFTTFVGAILWVLRRGSSEEYQQASLLPFQSNSAQARRNS